MSHAKPFHRNWRGFVPSSNSDYSQWAYIVDRSYAEFPEHYVRAFMLIQKDLQTLFEFIEPSDTNLVTYSHRTHALLIRTCIEIEANFKNLLNSVAGLLVLLSSQFGTQDFSPGEESLTANGDSYYSGTPALGGFFHIEFPKDWSDAEKIRF